MTARLDLVLRALREANMARLPLFRNRAGGPAHSRPDGSDWSPTRWLLAVAGEFGEACNEWKKIGRGDYGPDGPSPLGAFVAELADTATYLDILAFRLGLGPIRRGSLPRGLDDVDATLSFTLRELGLIEQRLSTRSAEFESHAAVAALERAAFLAAGADLGDAIVAKFNVVSDRVGAAVRMRVEADALSERVFVETGTPS